MDAFTLPPLSERAPLPPYVMPLCLFTLITALSLPATYNLRFLLLLTIAVPTLATLPFYTTGSVSNDYWVGSSFGIWTFTAVDYLLLSRPEKEFWRVQRKGPARDIGEGSVEEEREKSRWDGVGWSVEKWLWSAGIWLAPRGVGWSWEVKNLAPKKPAGYPSWKFLLTHLLRALTFYILVDICQIYIHTLPQARDPPALLSAEPALGQVALAWLFWAEAYVFLNLALSFTVVLATLSGIWEPRDFPDAFGRLRDAWSVRQFWGRTWHQLLRRPVSSFGRSAVRLLGFRKGTNASSYTQLYAGFVVSALIHTAATFFIARRDTGDMRFFISQAVAITLEDVVIATAVRLGLQSAGWLGKIIGYLWVIAWLSYSLRGWVGGGIAVGLWVPQALPYSPVSRAMELLEGYRH
ncbi:MAG: hypothetical protein M1839_008157 [Geoglossum umbratile]|nr:MAG: hypothetical protein M1839_008157 [Geoglossum umbratile]